MKEIRTHPAFSKIILFRGFSNGNQDYDEGKKAIQKGWPKLSEAQISEALEDNYWIGGVIAGGQR